jgi:hypothetical protein
MGQCELTTLSRLELREKIRRCRNPRLPPKKNKAPEPGPVAKGERPGRDQCRTHYTPLLPHLGEDRESAVMFVAT